MDYARRLRGQCHALGHGLVRSRLFNRPWLLADLSIKAGLAAQAVGLWPGMKGPHEKWREAMAAIFRVVPSFLAIGQRPAQPDLP